MRFFIKIKENGKQLGLKRIESKHQLVNTNQLITLIEKSIHINPTSFIVRMINDQNRFRIVNGWTLLHYGIKSGLQLQVQLLKAAKQQMVISEKNQNQNIGQLLFHKKEMDKIIQEDQQQAEKSLQISHLVQKKYDELLKLIQKNNTQAYLREVKEGSPTLGACQNEYYKKQLLAIQNQLGTNGWAAIHCAVFVGNSQIVNFLIDLGVDINLKSSDEWLPIQLAIKQQRSLIIDLLISQPSLNINICTGQGLALNMAVQSLNKQIIAKLLTKDVNFSAKDQKGRTVYDILGSQTDQQIRDLLNREERRQSISHINLQKFTMYHTLISSYRGDVICIRTPPRKNKQYYLSINPYEGVIKVYEDKTHFSQYPKQILPINLINKFKQMSKSQKSWYMKNDLFYFVVSTPKTKYIFGCCFQSTVQRWVSSFELCLEHFNKYTDSIKHLQRNDNVIMDRIQQPIENKRKVSKNNKEQLINLFTSKASLRSDESPEKNRGIIVNFQKQTPSPQKKQAKKDSQKETKKEIKKQTKKDEPQSPQILPIKKQKLQPLPKTQTQPKVQTLTQEIKARKQSENIQSQQNLLKNGLKFTDFRITKVLGQGSFGTVYLAMDMRNPEKKKQYALKCFKKKKLVINKQIKYTIAELNILKQLSHPFIVNLHFTFQTPNYVYLGLDYCPNRDLSHHLMNQVNFPEKEAAIYTAQILLALQYLHEKNIIYRDLKPQNIMLDQQGHVKLVDFGLSKQGQDRQFVAKSFCGSPAYLSPQMLIKKGVGKQSDFYCLGAVLYQMLVGEPPFFSDDITTLYNNISRSKLTFPKSLSNEAKSLLTGLLQRNPQQRLGYKGTSQIKQHPFFNFINWANLLKKTINAPTRQQIQIQHQEDSFAIQNIHKDFDYSPQNYRINRFLNFSFVRQNNNQN